MKNKWIYRIIGVLLLVAICVVMFIVGRGHTVYFDNKMYEKNNYNISSYNKIEVIVKNETVDIIAKRERTMATTIGQNFKFKIKAQKTKNDDFKEYDINIKLPYNMDGIILNLPAMIEGVPVNECIEEFIPTPAATEEEETVVTDEFSFEG